MAHIAARNTGVGCNINDGVNDKVASQEILSKIDSRNVQLSMFKIKKSSSLLSECKGTNELV